MFYQLLNHNTMPTKAAVKSPTTKTSASKTVAPKKVAKPVAVKKTTAKKAVAKKTSTPMKCATCAGITTQEQAFWVNNGPVIDSLMGLRQALQDMSDEQFAYHTARAGNDFASWVRDCLGDVTCAVRIAKARTRDGAVRAIVCTCK
jgi:hypothetical protein